MSLLTMIIPFRTPCLPVLQSSKPQHKAWITNSKWEVGRSVAPRRGHF